MSAVPEQLWSRSSSINNQLLFPNGGIFALYNEGDQEMVGESFFISNFKRPTARIQNIYDSEKWKLVLKERPLWVLKEKVSSNFCNILQPARSLSVPFLALMAKNLKLFKKENQEYKQMVQLTRKRFYFLNHNSKIFSVFQQLILSQKFAL